jgi:alkanesulfonate monooxygenase SsuD/methylene tetrahydromethanopterin reductase-like flavin-dependent oxidoreductase (luciferase family)
MLEAYTLLGALAARTSQRQPAALVTVADQVGALLDTGLDGLIFNMPHTHDPDDVRRAGELLAPLVT